MNRGELTGWCMTWPDKAADHIEKLTALLQRAGGMLAPGNFADAWRAELETVLAEPKVDTFQTTRP